MFAFWGGDDFGDVDRPRKSKKKVLTKQTTTKRPEIRLEEKIEVKEVVKTPSGPVAVSATAAEYSVGNNITIDTIDIDAENIKTEATLKVDAFVVSETATGEVVCEAGVIEYSDNKPEEREIVAETVPIKSAESYIEWTQKMSSAGKKKKDKSDKKKSKKEKQKESQSTLIENEDQLYKMALASQSHAEGKKTKKSTTIANEQDLKEYIKQRSGNQYYGAYFDPSTSSMQGGRSTVDVSVPLAPRLQVGHKKDPLLDVEVPLVGMQVGDKKPVNIITTDDDMDEYIKDMMEMREAGMAKKSSSKEGAFTQKQKKKYERKQKFMAMLKQHETQARANLNAMGDDPSTGKKRQIILKMLEFINITERIVAKSKPEDLDRIYKQYSHNMKKFNDLLR